MNNEKIPCKTCKNSGLLLRKIICGKCKNEIKNLHNKCDNCGYDTHFLVIPSPCTDCEGSGWVDDVAICYL